MTIVTEIVGLDHVQLAMPPGEEARAREFYIGVLGLVEEPKPSNLAPRSGAWFKGGSLRLHLGVDRDFRPAGRLTRPFWSTDSLGLSSGVARPGIHRCPTNRSQASPASMCSTRSATGLS